MIQLKRCTVRDIPEIRNVALQSYEEHYLYLWTAPRFADWYMDRSFSEANLTAQFQEPNAHFYLVYWNEKMVGFIKLNWYKALPGDAAAHSLELERIYLINEVSGKGVGTEVLNEIINSCLLQGVHIIWLKSMDSSDSVFFYQKRGFEITAKETLPFEGFKDEYRTLLTMRRLLKKEE
ncbi:MAG: GNAT family N-acetyltransferase [Chitinophagaceae bacterium]